VQREQQRVERPRLLDPGEEALAQRRVRLAVDERAGDGRRVEDRARLEPERLAGPDGAADLGLGSTVRLPDGRRAVGDAECFEVGQRRPTGRERVRLVPEAGDADALGDPLNLPTPETCRTGTRIRAA
jgi:hypothetical protein